MIIQCEQCNTKFRLDDSKVTDKGVKVRCAKCRHVFSVTKDQQATEAQPDLDAMLDQPQPDFGAMLDGKVAFTAEEQSSASSAPSAPTVVPGFDYSDFVSNDFADQEVKPEPAGFTPPGEEPAPVSGSDDFSLSSLDGEQGFALGQDETGTTAGAADFGDFDFEAPPGDADKTVVAGSSAFDFSKVAMEAPPAPSPAAGAEDAGAFDFGDISMGPPPGEASAAGREDAAALDFGGEIDFGEKGTAPLSSEEVERFALDAGGDFPGAADTIVAGAALPLPTKQPAEPKAEESFSLGEFEFGDEQPGEPVQAIPAGEPEPVREAPLVSPGEAPAAAGRDADGDTIRKGPEPALETLQTPAEELPPLSIGSRRKQGPLFGVLIAVATVVAVTVLGFFGYTMFLEDKGKVVTETGRITVRAVNASFVKNPVIGDLLVITGEAVNGFSKPRAAIQIKGMVYGPGGQVLVSKNAYCGNPLTKEQLSTLSLDKIEAAMANQFGDSLVNMEVTPGKGIPFVIVIAKPPAEARDYGVEPAGSTVATGKQQ